jgi:hypothetical protein
MSELRAAKMISATLLICSGAVCLTIGGLPTDGNARSFVGLVLLAFGIPMLVRQWTGEGVLTHLRDGLHRLRYGLHRLFYTPWLTGAKSPIDERSETTVRT